MSKSKKRKTFDNEFKNNAVHYVNEHTELTHAQAAANLDIGLSTLSRWRKEAFRICRIKINVFCAICWL